MASYQLSFFYYVNNFKILIDVKVLDEILQMIITLFMWLQTLKNEIQQEYFESELYIL